MGDYRANTGRLFELLVPTEAEPLQFKLVLLRSAFICAKQVWRTALKTTGRLFEQLAPAEAKPVQFQDGAASQHIICAKHVWRTALKSTG